MTDKFCPEAFNITKIYNGGNNITRNTGLCYMLCSSSEKKEQYRLYFPTETAEKIEAIIGDRVNCGFDGLGQGEIYFWAGTAFKLTGSGKTKYLTVTNVGKDYVNLFGHFRKLYFKVTYGDNFVKFTPTGERD